MADEFDEPQSRIEAILQNMLGANNELEEPQSRNEALLQQILEQGGTGGAGEMNVQSDWNQTNPTKDDFIKNKPTIPAPYNLPVASESTLGGVKVDGTTVVINNGVISAVGEGGTVVTAPVNFVHAAGAKLFDDNGNEYLVKGMNFDNWVWFNPSVPMEWYCNENSYAELAEMGVNTVRWYLNYALLEDDNNPYVYKSEGWEWLDQNIAWADKYGIKMIINMHVPQSLPETDSWDTTVESIQLWYGNDATENRARLKAMWQAIATRYKDDPAVLGYGLLNEPRVPYINNSIADSKAQWETLAAELVELIRAIDTKHILFIEPTTKIHDTVNDVDTWDGFDYVDGMFTVNDNNYAVEFHFYNPLEITHQRSEGGYPVGGATYPDSNGYTKETLRSDLLEYLAFRTDNNVPLYMGEFGAFVESYPYGGRQWISDMVDLSLEYDLSASFHEYKPGLYDDYYYSVVDNNDGVAETGTDVLDTHLYKIFKDRWKGLELTQSILENKWSVQRIRSMGIGNSCWDYYDPSNAYLSNYIDEDGYAELAEKGFNSVRFYVNYKTFEDSYDTTTKVSTFKETGWTWLDQHVAWCAANHLRMVISLHVPPGGFMKEYATGPFWDEDKMQRTQNVWVAIAQRYAGSETVVGFDLLNEPYLAAITGSTDGELELEAYYEFVNNMIAAIRKVNTSAFFVIQRPYGYIKSGVQKYYGYTSSYQIVNDDKALYDLHFYYWNSYTHQEYAYGNLETRVNYPDSAMAVKVYGNGHSNTKYNAVSFNYASSGWQTVESPMIEWDDSTYKYGTWALTFDDLGENGSVYVDDITVKEYDSDGNYIRDMSICDFEHNDKLTSWNANNATGASKELSEDYNSTSDGAKSMKVTVATGEINVAPDDNYQYIYPVAGNYYKIVCKMQFVGCANTAAVRMWLRPFDGEGYPYTKLYLEGVLKKFMKWAKQNSAELYIGEFSCTVPLMENRGKNDVTNNTKPLLGGKEWLQDAIDLFDEYGLHYSFHDYHSPTFGYYKDAMNVSVSTKVANTDAVFEEYVE